MDSDFFVERVQVGHSCSVSFSFGSVSSRYTLWKRKIDTPRLHVYTEVPITIVSGTSTSRMVELLKKMYVFICVFNIYLKFTCFCIAF